MIIAEALAEADALYENTFSAKQKIAWCDELGALLKNEYAKTYKQEALERENGDYLLPEDITFSEVERFFIQGRACTKKELQRMGYQFVEEKPRCKIKPEAGAIPLWDAAAVYLEQYTPIKDIHTDETVAKSPYDRMYIDYLIAKCNYYNRDFNGYNQHMTYFNNLLSGFATDFIRKNEPLRRELRGWW